jgi:protein SCO1/2
MRPALVHAAALGTVLAFVGVAPPAVAQPAHHHERPTAGRPGGDSIYAVPATFRDQEGRAVALDVFRGHPVLVTMFYATCRDACPLLIAQLHRLEREVPVSARSSLRILLVSLDPERDTPAALEALARSHHVEDARWRFLQAPDDDTVRVIAAVLGIKYRRLADGHVNHSSVIGLLDATGAIDARIEGAGPPSETFLERLRALAQGAPSVRAGAPTRRVSSPP